MFFLVLLIKAGKKVWLQNLNKALESGTARDASLAPGRWTSGALDPKTAARLQQQAGGAGDPVLARLAVLADAGAGGALQGAEAAERAVEAA